jgi:Na+/melibiose symporter-like transporter
MGVLICGLLLQLAGIVSGADEQTPEAVRNISILTFLSGPIVIIGAFILLRRYPVNRESIRQMEAGS